MTSIPEQWVEQARYDLETARAMLTSGRYLYVVFCCQQAAEKMLKALIAKRTGESPPRTHNLVRLAERAGVTPSEEQADLFRELSAHYIQSRYPEQVARMGGLADQDKARAFLQKTEVMIEWLCSMT